MDEQQIVMGVVGVKGGVGTSTLVAMWSGVLADAGIDHQILDATGHGDVARAMGRPVRSDIEREHHRTLLPPTCTEPLPEPGVVLVDFGRDPDLYGWRSPNALVVAFENTYLGLSHILEWSTRLDPESPEAWRCRSLLALQTQAESALQLRDCEQVINTNERTVTWPRTPAMARSIDAGLLLHRPDPDSATLRTALLNLTRQTIPLSEVRS